MAIGEDMWKTVGPAIALLASCTLAVSGCGSAQRSPIDRLPPGYKDRVRLEQRDDGSARLVVTQGIRFDCGQGAWARYPLSAHGEAFIPAVVQGPGERQRRRLRFLLDTGSNFQVRLDARTAGRLRAWVSEEAEPLESVDVLGASPSFPGVLGELRIGPVLIQPAAVLVGAARVRVPPTLGETFIDRCLRGVVIDRRAGSCAVLFKTASDGATPETPQGWVGIPWERSFLAGESESSEGRRSAMRTIPVRVGDREYRAVLDTGSPAGVFSFVDLPVDGPAFEESIRAAGRRGRAVTRTLSEPLHVGPLTLEGVLVTRAAVPDGAERSPALVIGLATLGDVPVWFDPIAGEVRLWMREGPAELPAPQPTVP